MTAALAARARPSRRPLIPLFLVMAILAAAGLSLSGHYGFSTDETRGIDMVQWNYEHLIKGTPMNGDSEFYGPVFNIPAEVVFLGVRKIRRWSGHEPAVPADPNDSSYRRYRDRMGAKHAMTFLVSLLAYGAVAWIVAIWCGWGYAWLGPVTLAALPRFWGHSFFNPKDIPFAAGMTVATLAGALLIERLLRANSRGGRDLPGALLASGAYGALVGLVAGIRIGGLVFLGTVPLALLVVWIAGRSRRDSPPMERGARMRLLHLAAAFLVMGVACFATVILVHPASWAAPFEWVPATLRYMAAHPWSGDMLFEGRYGPPEITPWYYLPKFVGITTPLVLLGAAAAGLVWLAAKWPRLGVLGRAAAVLVLLQMLFMPAVAIALGSTMYNGLRQFLFVLPPIAALAAAGIAWTDRLLVPRPALRLIAAAALAAATGLIFMKEAELHPYEYIYFNRLVGGVGGAQHGYELDYWHLSYREGAEWINHNSGPAPVVLVGGSYAPARIFFEPGTRVMPRRRADVLPAEPFFYLSVVRHGSERLFPGCPVVYPVMRDGAPLSVVKRCPAGTTEQGERFPKAVSAAGAK